MVKGSNAPASSCSSSCCCCWLGWLGCVACVACVAAWLGCVACEPALPSARCCRWPDFSVLWHARSLRTRRGGGCCCHQHVHWDSQQRVSTRCMFCSLLHLFQRCAAVPSATSQNPTPPTAAPYQLFSGQVLPHDVHHVTHGQRVARCTSGAWRGVLCCAQAACRCSPLLVLHQAAQQAARGVELRAALQPAPQAVELLQLGVAGVQGALQAGRAQLTTSCMAGTAAWRPQLHGGHSCLAATAARRPQLHGGHSFMAATASWRPQLHGGHS
jgi:hypothetical protein